MRGGVDAMAGEDYAEGARIVLNETSRFKRDG